MDVAAPPAIDRTPSVPTAEDGRPLLLLLLLLLILLILLLVLLLQLQLLLLHLLLLPFSYY